MKEQNEGLTPADTAAMLGVINQHLLEALVIIAPMIRMLGAYTAMPGHAPPAPEDPKAEIDLPEHFLKAITSAGYKTAADLLRDPAMMIQERIGLTEDAMKTLVWLFSEKGFKISGAEYLK